MSKESIISASAYVRSAARNIGIKPNPWGLYDGFVSRESTMADLRVLEENWDFGESEIKDKILQISAQTRSLPNPFWTGIHPSIAREIYGHADDETSGYWDTPMGNKVKPAKTRVVYTEPNINRDDISEQVKFIQSHLPKGSVHTFFATNGVDTIWKNIPIASSFSENSHQMSIPMGTNNIINGFNSILITTTPAVTLPDGWRSNETISKQ